MKAKLLVLSLFILLPFGASAQIPSLYTLGNFFTSLHDTPRSVNSDGDGGYYGYTATGLLYRQTDVKNTAGIRLARFSIGEAYFYMSDKGLIKAESTIAAVSIYLTRD